MHSNRLRTALAAVAVLLAAGLLSCGPSEEELLLAELQEGMDQASATIDSLNYQVDSVNLLLDDARAQADSLNYVNEKLLSQVQNLNKEVKSLNESTLLTTPLCPTDTTHNNKHSQQRGDCI